MLHFKIIKPFFKGTKKNEYVLWKDDNGKIVKKDFEPPYDELITLLQNAIKFARFFRCKVQCIDIEFTLAVYI